MTFCLRFSSSSSSVCFFSSSSLSLSRSLRASCSFFVFLLDFLLSALLGPSVLSLPAPGPFFLPIHGVCFLRDLSASVPLFYSFSLFLLPVPSLTQLVQQILLSPLPLWLWQLSSLLPQQPLSLRPQRQLPLWHFPVFPC